MTPRENGFELLLPTGDPDVVLLRSAHHGKLVVFAIVGPLGAVVAAWFDQWGLVGLALALAIVALVIRSKRTVIDRRHRRCGSRYPWSPSRALPDLLGPEPIALHKRLGGSRGTVEVTYDLSVGGHVLASGLLWADAEKLAGELARFLGEPAPS